MCKFCINLCSFLEPKPPSWFPLIEIFFCRHSIHTLRYFLIILFSCLLFLVYLLPFWMKLSIHLKISKYLNKIWFYHCGQKRPDKCVHNILLKLQSWVCILNLSLTFLVLFSQTNPASTSLSRILKIECYLLLSSGC